MKKIRTTNLALIAAFVFLFASKAHAAIILSGTLYSDEGTTPISGQTVRLLIDGISEGSNITDGSGNYSITTTVATGDTYLPLLVYVDDGTVDGTTVTVLDSTTATTINDLHIYADHLITRQDAGSAPLDTGDMSNAKNLYSDGDILYSISWPNTIVTGVNTELYVASGHFYAPQGDVTTPHVKIEGTLTGGSNTFTVSGNFDQSSTSSQVDANSSTIIVDGNFSADGTIDSTNYNNATLVMNGTGSLTYNNLSSYWNSGFRYLTVGQSGNITTLNSVLAVIRQLVVGSGSLNSGSSVFLLGTPTPLVVHANSTINLYRLRFFGNATQNLPPLNNGYDSTIQLARHGTTVKQAGNVTINVGNGLILNGDTFVDRAVTYNTNGFDLTVGGNLQVGEGGDTALKRFDMTNSTVIVGGNIEVRSSGSVQADIISTGSTVTLNGSTNQTITSSGSSFNNLILDNTGSAGQNSIILNDVPNINSDLTITSGILDTTSSNNYDINVSGNFDQSSTSSQVEANSSTITVGGNFSADGTLDRTNYNNASLVLTNTGNLTYNNLSQSWSNGFRYLTVGQTGNTTTLFNSFTVTNQLTVGSGVLIGTGSDLFLKGSTPLRFDPNSILNIHALRFFGTTQPIQYIPPLINGYDSHIVLSTPGITVIQTGDITLNSGKRLLINGDGVTSHSQTYNTNEFDLTVGENLVVGVGNDTGLKTLNISNSTVQVAGNFDIHTGTNDLISMGSTVILNGTTLQTITTNSSNFNNLVVTNTSDVTFADSFTTNNFTNTTPSSQMTFKGGLTYTINSALNLNGQAINSEIQLRSSDTSQYIFDVTAATQTVQYVDVAYSASNNNDIQAFYSTNSGNNDNADPTPHWVFVDGLLVTNTLDDTNLGSLRYALANVTTGETINFDPSVFLTATPATITLTNPLPNITQGSVTLDASNVGVIIVGNRVQDCLKIDSNNNTIKGLRIQNCTRDGIGLYSGNGNTIGGNNSVGSGPSGQGNIIVYNGNDGIDVSSSATGNFIYGNYIGTDPSSSAGLGNGVDGINMMGSSNVIGGTGNGQSNVISNNGDDGIQLVGDSNTVQANYIGTNEGGTAILGNTDRGIHISGSSNTIGGNSSATRNIISGNFDGLLISSNNSNNVISGNYIGTDVTGLVALGNTRHGIFGSGSSNTTIGGTSSGERNIISGNADAGIRISNSNNTNIIGNYIGVDSTGSVALANGGRGIEVRGATTSGTMIGSTSSGSANVISGNVGDGIQTTGTTTIIGNYIGTNATNIALPNGGDGIEIWHNSPVTLGHASETQDNIFGNNTGSGINLGQGSLTIAGNVDLNDDISLESGQTLALGAGTLSISGNWLNSGTTVTADTSTVEFDGTTEQTITSAGQSFNDLNISNASSSGVTFTDSFTTNNFTNTTANSKMTFAAGQTYTINGAATLQGASGQPLTLASSSPGTHWNFVLNSGATKAIDYVSVSWSDASGSHSTNNPILPTNSNNGGNNIDWFGSNISVNKTSALISDPVNGTGAGKNHIPGAIVEYTITTTNSGDSSPDASSIIITDSVDGNVEYDVSGISFAAYNSGLSVDTVTYAHKNTPTSYTYVPVGTYDPNVASIKVTTNGTFNHSDAPDPRFTVTYRIRIR